MRLAVNYFAKKLIFDVLKGMDYVYVLHGGFEF